MAAAAGRVRGLGGVPVIRHGQVALVAGQLVQLVAWWCGLCLCHHRGDCTHPLG